MKYWMEDWRCGMDGILDGALELWDGCNIGWTIGGVG